MAFSSRFTASRWALVGITIGVQSKSSPSAEVSLTSSRKVPTTAVPFIPVPADLPVPSCVPVSNLVVRGSTGTARPDLVNYERTKVKIII